MKKRYLYALLFGVPGLFISGIVTLFIFGALFGILWIYVFGDNLWPASAENILSSLLVLTFLVLWIASIAIGYGIGKKLEKDPGLNWNHIRLASGLTIVLIGLLVLQQWRVGNIGPKSEAVLCSDYCSLKGYSGSGMPPQDSGDRSCSCYDVLGNEVLKVPIDSIDPD